MNKTELIQKAVGFQKEINRLIMGYRTEKWLALNVTITQLKSLIYIYNKGKASFKDLAGALNVSPPVVTGIVDRLSSQHIIKRIDNTGDRRIQWLTITEKGKQLLSDIRQDSSDEMVKMLEVLSEEDIAALVQGFSALIKTAENNITGNEQLAVAVNNRQS
ncbi:MAG: MarR family transcriptional regulator [Dehalococcoidales bacterium]|jgi:DNA-binding MarR family transcriptional regulator|nr:MarR family transcriptional regulator [Dehalococcoidales bacterium]MDD3994634.1 MarR family transcriptional regulator [Dehalococcoidales bacterium]